MRNTQKYIYMHMLDGKILVYIKEYYFYMIVLLEIIYLFIVLLKGGAVCN